MPTYLVERVLPGADLTSVEALCRAAASACGRFTADDNPIRYVRTTFTPGQSRCSCLFEAANADLVRAVNEAAQIPYTRIVLAVDLPNGNDPPHQSPLTDTGGTS